MEIQRNRKSATVFSPFGRKTRVFTDSGPSGDDIVIPRGSGLPDLARAYYGVTRVDPFKARFSFLDRDNKERSYSPGTEDKYVFRNAASIQQFKEHALRLIHELVELWSAIGLPTRKDADRGVTIPDSEKLWDALDPTSKLHATVKQHYRDIIFITSNVDIMKKACIVRGVIPGWWASSYSGKNAPDLQHFGPSLRAFVKAIKILEATPAYARVRAKTLTEIGDPLDTNIGYPLFSAEVDKAGNPVARLKVLEMYRNLPVPSYNFPALLKEVDRRARMTESAGYPFLSAPIRRLQPGYKFAHVYNQTAAGLTADYDERGNNTNRIAWMGSYILNLLLSPVQLEWKVIRKLMPGLFNDGRAKQLRMQQLKKSKAYAVEADYSNYDRFMPINLFLSFCKGYLGNKPHSDYWLQMLSHLHHGIPIAWPDYIANSKGNGWVFTPPRIGLLSGLKITSEEGTIVNNLVNAQSLLDMGMLSESDLVDYFLQYRNAEPGAGSEHYFIQSDDTLLINSDLGTLKKMGDAFSANTKRAGIKGSLELGDRFLMRQTYLGMDRPIISRIWQNSLSNEEPYEDPLTLVVGLVVRSDGVLGHRTFDPFGLGHTSACTPTEVKFTRSTFQSLLEFYSTATAVIPDARDYCKTIVEAADRMLLNGGSNLTIEPDFSTKLDNRRHAALKALAAREQLLLSAAASLTPERIKSMLYALHKDANVPSSQLLLDQILSQSSGLAALTSQISQKENAFYHFAMKKLNIPISL